MRRFLWKNDLCILFSNETSWLMIRLKRINGGVCLSASTKTAKKKIVKYNLSVDIHKSDKATKVGYFKIFNLWIFFKFECNPNVIKKQLFCMIKISIKLLLGCCHKNIHSQLILNF
jgi:hypothetical protein